MLLLGWEIAGPTGLVLPGLVGWVLWLVAAWRALRRSGPPGGDAHTLRRSWQLSAGAFLVLGGTTLVLGEGLLPAAWRAALVEALHIRRIHRSYGP